MNCYYCDQQRPGGTRFGVRAAVGICQHCGVAACAEHSYKAEAPGSPLLCMECAKELTAISHNGHAQHSHGKVAIAA